MNCVKEFIQTQNINSIDQFESIISNDPYNLKLKKFKNNELMIIVHTEDTNLEEELCLYSHGVIIDNDLNVIRYTGKKAIENEENVKTINENINTENIVMTPIIDGTFISVFKYDGKVYYSTKKAIEARLSKWHSIKNFEELFKEAVNDASFENHIQDNYVYNFILCSKENSNIVTYEESSVVLLSVLGFNSKESMSINFFENLLVNDNIKYIENMRIENIDNFFIDNDVEKLNYLGIFVTDHNNSQKIFFENYLKLKNILPNNHDILYTFLTLRKNTYMLQMYLGNNPNRKEQFENFETNICNFITFIHKMYLDMRIHKKKIVIPDFIRTTLYKIHGIYLTTKNPITLTTIFNHLNILHEKQLYVLIKNYNKHIIQQNTMEIDQVMDQVLEQVTGQEISAEDELVNLTSFNS